MSAMGGLTRRANRVELPKGAVAALCAMILALPAGFAVAHVAKVDSQGRWIHHHTLDYRTCNQIDQSTALRDQFNVARGDWGSSTSLVFNPETECHSGNPVHIQVLDGYLGNTGWRSSAINDPNGQNLGYHVTHTHLQFNLSTSWSDYTNYDRRALACREIGQIIGIERVWSGQYATHGTDCMAFGGNPSGQVSKDENSSNYTYTGGPGTDSTSLVNQRYGTEGPSLTLSGPLVVASQAKDVLSQPSYDLSIHAAGETHLPASVARLAVKIDGSAAWSHECGATQSCDATWKFQPWLESLSVGAHELTVTATDYGGFTREQELIVYVPDRFGLGKTDIGTYVTETLPGGGEVAVNVATGNAWLSATDVSVDDGLATGTFGRHYNSNSASDQGSMGLGWRLGLGEDVKLTDAGHGSFVWHTPSGAKALFVPGSGCSFKPSPGVSAELDTVVVQGQTVYEVYVPESDEIWRFDHSGQLIEIRAPTGPVYFTYTQGRLTRLSFEDGMPDLIVDRNASGLVSSVRRADAATPIVTYTYTGGRLTAAQSQQGTTNYGYDTAGLLRSVTHGGEVSEIEVANGTTQTVDPNSAVSGSVEFSYDPSQSGTDIGTTEVVEAGQVAEYGYDAVGEPESLEAGPTPPAFTSMETTAPDDINDPVDTQDPIVFEFEATDSTGIAWAGIVVDGGLAWEAEEPCGAGPCNVVEESVLIDASALPPGDYSAQVVVVDESGSSSERSLSFRTPAEGLCAEPEDDDWTKPTARTPVQSEIDEATAFRAANGLSTTNVPATFQNSTAVDAELRYGVPLTDAEEGQLEFRDNELADSLAVLEEYGQSEPAFAGAYVEPDHAAKVVALFTDDPAGHASASGFPYPAMIEARSAEHSLADLEGTADELTADVEGLESEGIQVELIYVDVRQNVVDVTIAPRVTDPPNGLLPLAEAKALLEQRYGTSLEVGTGEVEPFAGDRTPAGAAFDIFHFGQYDSECTVGFGLRYQYFGREGFGLLTAAHCVHPGQDGWAYFAGVDQVKLVRSVLGASEYIDAQYLRTSRRRYPLSVRVDRGRAPVSRVEGMNNDRPQSGGYCAYLRKNGGAACGFLTDVRYARSNSNVGSDKLRVLQLENSDRHCCGRPGDSGGPVWRRIRRSPGVKAAGIISGGVSGVPNLLLYEHVGEIEERLGVNIRHR